MDGNKSIINREESHGQAKQELQLACVSVTCDLLLFSFALPSESCHIIMAGFFPPPCIPPDDAVEHI
jgi:hypothetical protein